MSDKSGLAKVIESNGEFVKNLDPKPLIVTGTQQPRPWRGPRHPAPDYEGKGLIFVDYTTNILS